MPVNKNALLRYRIIDDCLTNPMKRYPRMQDIIEKIEQQTDDSISESMFSKDIQNMKRVYNAPIRYDKTHGGYCYTEPGFSIKEFPLNHQEIEALDFSTALLGLLKGTKLFQQYENAINKVIEGYRISKIIGKSEKQILQTEEPVRSADSRWLEIILKAIIEKTVLRINYQGFGKESKEHEFSPYLLKEYHNRWYVIGHSANRKRVIVLALDRIKNIETLKSRFVSDDKFNPADFFKYSLGITQLHGIKPEEVILSFTPSQAQYVLSQPLHHSQKVILQNNAEVQIRLKVYLSHELTMTVLSYGAGVRVVQPDSLKETVKNCIRDLKSLYKIN
jgi:predicted DNA-binding transcriptional regulator YafY